MRREPFPGHVSNKPKLDIPDIPGRGPALTAIVDVDTDPEAQPRAVSSYLAVLAHQDGGRAIAPSSLAPEASGERPVRGLRTSRRGVIFVGTGCASRCGAPCLCRPSGKSPRTTALSSPRSATLIETWPAGTSSGTSTWSAAHRPRGHHGAGCQGR